MAQSLLRLLLISLTLILMQGCAWYPPALDDKASALQGEIDAARSLLARQAAPYRSGQRDFYFAVSGKPISETLGKFNSLSDDDRTLTMSELSAGGKIFEVWTDCWLIPGRIGAFVAPVPFRYGMGAIVKIGSLSYSGWNPTYGVQYRLKGTAGAGYATFYGGAEVCGLEIPILPIAIVIVGGTFDSLGGAKLSINPAEGIDYSFQLEDPLVFAGILYVGGVGTFPIGFPLKPQLFSGHLPNMLGNQGKIQVIQGGEERKYVLDLRFTQANFVDQGLAASGTIAVTWK